MTGIQSGDILAFVKVDDTLVRVDLIESISDTHVITLEGTPYQLGDAQDAESVLNDMQAKVQELLR